MFKKKEKEKLCKDKKDCARNSSAKSKYLITGKLRKKLIATLIFVIVLFAASAASVTYIVINFSSMFAGVACFIIAMLTMITLIAINCKVSNLNDVIRVKQELKNARMEEQI